jgi:hypothetical protein
MIRGKCQADLTALIVNKFKKVELVDSTRPEFHAGQTSKPKAPVLGQVPCRPLTLSYMQSTFLASARLKQFFRAKVLMLQ